MTEGVVSVADVDTALGWGRGLRWGIIGQVLLNYLGGAQGGIEHFFIGSPQVTRASQRNGGHAEVGPRSIGALPAERADILLGCAP